MRHATDSKSPGALASTDRATIGRDDRTRPDHGAETRDWPRTIESVEALRFVSPGTMTQRIVEHHAARALLPGGRERLMRALERAHERGDVGTAFALAMILDEADWWGVIR